MTVWVLAMTAADLLLRAARWAPPSPRRPRSTATRHDGHLARGGLPRRAAGRPGHAGRHRAEQGVVPRVVGVCLMTVLEVVRHTRAEEEEGRAELVRAGVVGAGRGARGDMLVSGAAALLVGPGRRSRRRRRRCRSGTRCCTARRSPRSGWCSRRSRCAPRRCSPTPGPRAASGWPLFGVAYVVRGVGDVQGNGLVWLSPIGLVPGDARHRRRRDVVAAARPGRGDRPCSSALARYLAAAAARPGRRAGGRPARPREAARSLSGAFGLALRTQRPTAGRLGRWARSRWARSTAR